MKSIELIVIQRCIGRMNTRVFLSLRTRKINEADLSDYMTL